jgi:hypothetical protein
LHGGGLLERMRLSLEFRPIIFEPAALIGDVGDLGLAVAPVRKPLSRLQGVLGRAEGARRRPR